MGTLEIISRSGEPFRDRKQAGRLLGEELETYKDRDPLVLGVPRGGVVIAREVAEATGGDLDLIISRKLGAPDFPELAIGAVSENGQVFLDQKIVRELGVSEDYIKQERNFQVSEIHDRNSRYRRILPRLDPAGQTVIITDDGIATGSTVQAAIWSVRAEQPASIIVALPVGPEIALKMLAKDADELICLRVPPFFSAVGQFYYYFNQLSDEEVTEILMWESERRRLKSAPNELKKKVDLEEVRPKG